MTEHIPNIGPQGQRIRMQGGLIGLGVGFAGSIAPILSGPNRWWRGLLF
jgi:hypothetical protein